MITHNDSLALITCLVVQLNYYELPCPSLSPSICYAEHVMFITGDMRKQYRLISPSPSLMLEEVVKAHDLTPLTHKLSSSSF